MLMSRFWIYVFYFHLLSFIIITIIIIAAAMRAGIFRTIVRNPTNMIFINIEYWGCGGDNDWKRNIFAYGFTKKHMILFGCELLSDNCLVTCLCLGFRYQFYSHLIRFIIIIIIIPAVPWDY